MSFLSSFIASHLLPALEEAIVSHEQEIVAALLAEPEVLFEEIKKWIENKAAAKATAPQAAQPVNPVSEQ